METKPGLSEFYQLTALEPQLHPVVVPGLSLPPPSATPASSRTVTAREEPLWRNKEGLTNQCNYHIRDETAIAFVCILRGYYQLVIDIIYFLA